MELPVYATYYARSLSDLPPEAKLVEEVRALAVTLARLRAAPVVDPYSGPAILSGRAAGVFFHEIFGHRIEGSRQKTADDAQTFAKMVGQPILPPFLDVVADPTRGKLGDTELGGFYQYDDEGVRARRVAVVKGGVLGEFLMNRSPLSRFPRSNGHGRGQPGLRPVSRQSNLIVESSAGVPFAQLVERLKDEARKRGKSFGLLFDQVEGGFTFTGRYMPNAFNVTPVIVYRVLHGRPPAGTRARRRSDAARRWPRSARSLQRTTGPRRSTASAAPRAAPCRCRRRRRRCSCRRSRSRRSRSRRTRCRFCRRRPGARRPQAIPRARRADGRAVALDQRSRDGG
ncbi:MAG: metallopeptidase TldD-related protein [Desulfobacterales bacterium]|nr:metallopeptidase TldD-related protein [Desulfobacterales bacterium]